MNSEKLKPGFTTGAAAAAATKAALFYLIGSKPVETVEIRCLNNENIYIAIHSVKRLSDNCAEATVIKDAGDDPDVTHNAKIGARVLLHNVDELRAETEGKFDLTARRVDSEYSQTTAKSEIRAASIPSVIRPESITIRGGEGVGVVTKPGLEVQPGNPAINPGPQTMIREAVITVLCAANILNSNHLHGVTTHAHDDIVSSCNERQPRVDVEIFVPKGRELAKKTLNARLGILGGISILGTTGVVRPMSHDAYIATIRSGVSVARAMGGDTVVFTTGRRSERSAISLFPGLSEERFIQTGDFFKASLEAAISAPEGESSACIKKVIFVIFFGKAVKMAMGFPHTHAAKSELTMKTVAKWAEEVEGEALFNCDSSTFNIDQSTQYSATLNIDQNSINGNEKSLARRIAEANTARHAFTYIYPAFPKLISYIGNKVVESASRFSGNLLHIRAIILDFEGNPIFDSSRGCEAATKLQHTAGNYNTQSF